MQPAARVAAAIEVLDLWLAGRGRAEPLLRAWGKRNRFAGGGDRRAIADIVYDCLRRRRSFLFLSGASAETGRALALGREIAEGGDAAAVFGAGRFAPEVLNAEEAARAADLQGGAVAAALAAAPDPVRFDHPDWLEGRLRASLGEDYAAAMGALTMRAPVDLRVNTLKTGRAAALASLAEDGVAAEALEEDPDAIRCPPGARAAQSRAYADGWVEPMDVSSQRAARLAGAQPGETVVDLCAGGGGKTLALAAHMGGTGRLIAHDVNPGRMRDLPERAARAGAKVELVASSGLDALTAAADLVFVDAPCSGAGSWRRDPEGKWALTPERLDALIAAQAEALSMARGLVRDGGRIAYATCSVLADENEPGADKLAAAGAAECARLDTRALSGDGFFCVVGQF